MTQLKITCTHDATVMTASGMTKNVIRISGERKLVEITQIDNSSVLESTYHNRCKEINLPKVIKTETLTKLIEAHRDEIQGLLDGYSEYINTSFNRMGRWGEDAESILYKIETSITESDEILFDQVLTLDELKEEVATPYMKPVDQGWRSYHHLAETIVEACEINDCYIPIEDPEELAEIISDNSEEIWGNEDDI